MCSSYLIFASNPDMQKPAPAGVRVRGDSPVRAGGGRSIDFDRAAVVALDVGDGEVADLGADPVALAAGEGRADGLEALAVQAVGEGADHGVLDVHADPDRVEGFLLQRPLWEIFL